MRYRVTVTFDFDAFDDVSARAIGQRIVREDIHFERDTKERLRIKDSSVKLQEIKEREAPRKIDLLLS